MTALTLDTAVARTFDISSILKQMSLNPFRKPQNTVPDVIITPVMGIDSSIENAVQMLESAQSQFKGHIIADIDQIEEVYNNYREQIGILNPTKLQRISIILTERGHLSHYICGRLITYMVQDSFNHGYNDFYLVSGKNENHKLGVLLKGRKDEDLRFTIEGQARECAKCIEYCYVTFNSSTSLYNGCNSKDSTFDFHERITESFGMSSDRCTYIFRQGIKNLAFLTEELVISLKDCRIITACEDTYNHFLGIKSELDSSRVYRRGCWGYKSKNISDMESEENRVKCCFTVERLRQ